MLNIRGIKAALTEDQITKALTQLGSGTPTRIRGALVFDTVCHNHSCGSKKLYYYCDSKMFKCYTACADSFDIFELIKRVFLMKGTILTLSQSIQWLQKNGDIFFTDTPINQNLELDTETIEKELTYYSRKQLDILKFYIIKDWLDQGIQIQSMKKFEIKYNPVSCCVIIPHFDLHDNLIGIRQRTLVADEESYGKYRPAFINSKSYPHPLSYNLFGLNINEKNIIALKKAIVFEGEKSVLLMDKYPDSCAVACCGSNLSAYQVKLLLDLGVEEIILAFDKEFIFSGDELFIKQVKNLSNISKRFCERVTISFIFDKWNCLKLKDSPIDAGIDTFNFLLKERFSIKKESSDEI